MDCELYKRVTGFEVYPYSRSSVFSNGSRLKLFAVIHIRFGVQYYPYPSFAQFCYSTTFNFPFVYLCYPAEIVDCRIAVRAVFFGYFFVVKLIADIAHKGIEPDE